jgi:hypothetical protein
MPGWETLEFIIRGRKTRSSTELDVGGAAGKENQPLSSPAADSTFSADHSLGSNEQERTDKLTESWKKLKSKLKRSVSRKSLRSLKSSKSTTTVNESRKSTATVNEVGKDGGNHGGA